MARPVTFERDEILFARRSGSRFSSVHDGARLAAPSVREVRCDRLPPEVVRSSGEILFISKRDEAALDLFARVHAIPRVRRHDVWADLLEPYLDTEFDADHQARTIERLLESGFARQEIEELRALVEGPMLRYNALLWDWVHLGHLDLLAAMDDALPRSELPAFYARSMEVANRGRRVESEPWSLADQLRLHWYEVETSIGAAIGSTGSLLAELLARYSEPHRAYHGQAHLLAVVESVTASALENDARSAALLAAWFHDAVYNPGARDNEVASAALLDELASPHARDHKLIERAAALVLGTARPFEPDGDAARALADADLAILAEEQTVYLRYAEAIRAEHGSLSDAAFRAGRIAFLREVEEVQRRRTLYHGLHPLHEALARENVAAEIRRLAT